jgi:hypothetical protein
MTQHARLPHFAIMALRRLFLPMAKERAPDVIIGGAASEAALAPEGMPR